MENFDALQRSQEQLEAESLIAQQTKRARMRGAVAAAAKQSRVRALDSTVENPESLLAAIEKLPNVRIVTSVGGEALAGKDLLTNESLNAVQLCERALLSNESLKDGRSTHHIENVNHASELIKCKADLRTDLEKMKYIDAYGLPAFTRLPLFRLTRL